MSRSTLFMSLALTVSPYAVACESDLVSLDEAEATIHWDMLALDNGRPVTAHAFELHPDVIEPNLRAEAPIDERVLGPARLEVLRGYARHLARKRDKRAVFYKSPYFYEAPFVGVVYDEVTGEAIESLGIRSSDDPGPRLTRQPQHQKDDWLVQELREELSGSQHRGGLRAAPRWALVNEESLPSRHLTSSLLWSDDVLADDGMVNITRLRALPDYATHLGRRVAWKNFANRHQAAPRARLVYGMKTRGYPVEMMSSVEMDLIIGRVKDLTRDTNYDLTLFWDDARMIEITRGRVVRRGR